MVLFYLTQLPIPLPKRRGVFHKNTRIAFGSNGHRMHLQEQMLRHKAQYGCAVSCFGIRNMLKHASGVSELLFVLCIALTPQSGDSSGSILGVRSVALLHPQFSANTEAQMTI